MITVRSIIVEALNRSNIVSRRQSAPADMIETGLQLLKGIAKQYSNDNLLQFLVADCETTHSKQEYVLGDFDANHAEEYAILDVDAPLIQKVNKVYWRSKEPQGLGSYIDLQFASPEDFDMYPNGSGVYTWQPINDLQVVLKVKLLPDERTELKVNYNKKWSFDLNSELRIPEQYEELFIVALTHAFALSFPRLSPDQVDRIKTSLDDMIKNVKTSTRAVKYVSRRPTVPAVNRAAFLNGSMFLGG